MEKTKKCAAGQSIVTSDKDIAMHVSMVSILINVILSLLKLVAGIIGKSGAMISDAIHSASDVFSTFVVMIGVTISNRQSDKEHPYGHERLECVAAVVLAVILAFTGLGIGIVGVKKITGGHYGKLQIPGLMALIAALISIVVKEAMYWYTRSAAKKINSGALMADAWHHRSDALSSVGSFIGILGARIGFPILDPIASVVICVFIEKASLDIFRDAMEKMVDKSGSEEIMEEMKSVILSIPDVVGIDEIKTRLFGSKMYADVEILMDGSKTLVEAHEVAEEVHLAIEENFPAVKHCMVHVNPKVNDVEEQMNQLENIEQ